MNLVISKIRYEKLSWEAVFTPLNEGRTYKWNKPERSPATTDINLPELLL